MKGMFAELIIELPRHACLSSFRLDPAVEEWAVL